MGLAWGQWGGGLQARVGEAKLRKGQPRANRALSRALLGTKGEGRWGNSPDSCHLRLPLWSSDLPRIPKGGGEGSPASASYRGRQGPD